jgi:hypothetical protein
MTLTIDEEHNASENTPRTATSAAKAHDQTTHSPQTTYDHETAPAHSHRLATQVNKPCICDKIADPTCEPDDDDNDD